MGKDSPGQGLMRRSHRLLVFLDRERHWAKVRQGVTLRRRSKKSEKFVNPMNTYKSLLKLESGLDVSVIIHTVCSFVEVCKRHLAKGNVERVAVSSSGV